MRKTITMLTLVLFVLLSVTMSGVGILSVSAANTAEAGDVIKGKELSTLYYLGEDGKRYVFPNDKTYFSWYDNFDDVIEVDMEELYQYPLGGNVQYRPGSLLVKIQTDPKVYAVGKNGKLRWVKTETVAQELYGENWNLLIDDVPDPFFTNYSIDEPVENGEAFNPNTEEDESPEISYNLGLRERVNLRLREIGNSDRQCARLQLAVNKIQKRLGRLGIEREDIGDEYINQCSLSGDQAGQGNQNNKRWRLAEKVEVCHIPPTDSSTAQTLEIAQAALPAHLAHGDYIGPCDGEEVTTEEDSNTDEEDTTTDEEESEDNGANTTDETAPVISNGAVIASGTTATITWDTDEDATGMLYYATEPLSNASDIMTEEEEGYSMEHSVTLDGLATTSTYYYYVESSDKAGNTATSTEDSFEF